LSFRARARRFWERSARRNHPLVENNLILECARSVGFGLGHDPGTGSRLYADNPYPTATGYMGHYDGIIRENVVCAGTNVQDTGISLEAARGARVYHNTVVSADGSALFFSSIDYPFANSVVDIRNDLTRRITARDGATATVSSNFENTPLTYFVNPAQGNFQLSAGAAQAIDKGAVLAEAGIDMNGRAHDVGAPDLGAYERQP
jgi:hypothetical protein